MQTHQELVQVQQDNQAMPNQTQELIKQHNNLQSQSSDNALTIQQYRQIAEWHFNQAQKCIERLALVEEQCQKHVESMEMADAIWQQYTAENNYMTAETEICIDRLIHAREQSVEQEKKAQKQIEIIPAVTDENEPQSSRLQLILAESQSFKGHIYNMNLARQDTQIEVRQERGKVAVCKEERDTISAYMKSKCLAFMQLTKNQNEQDERTIHKLNEELDK